MRIETVINAAVIWAAAPACPTGRRTRGHGGRKTRTCRNSFPASETCTAITSRTPRTLTGITRMSAHWEVGPRHAEHPFRRR